LVAGLVVKLVSQPFFLRFVGDTGMLYSTMLGLAVTLYLMFKAMHDLTKYSIQSISRRTLLILVLSIGMGLATVLTANGLELFLNPESKLQSLLSILITGAVGVLVYGFLAL